MVTDHKAEGIDGPLPALTSRSPLSHPLLGWQAACSQLWLLLAEDFGVVTSVRKFMQVLINGRDTLLELDEPLSLRALLGEELTP